MFHFFFLEKQQTFVTLAPRTSPPRKIKDLPGTTRRVPCKSKALRFYVIVFDTQTNNNRKSQTHNNIRVVWVIEAFTPVKAVGAQNFSPRRSMVSGRRGRSRGQSTRNAQSADRPPPPIGPHPPSHGAGMLPPSCPLGLSDRRDRLGC